MLWYYLKALIRVMKTHPDESSLIVVACLALTVLANHVVLKGTIKSAGGIDVARAAKVKFPENFDVVQQADALLLYLL